MNLDADPQNPPRDKLPLLERFVRLRESLPHVELGEWPTPVENAPAFAKAHGLKSFHIKREDRSHARCGGNKVRGLEFVLGEARRRDAKTIVTFSSVGSHHICRTAFHARRFNIRTVALIVDQPPADYLRSNLGMGIQQGTAYIRAGRLTVIPKLLIQLLRHSSDDAAPCMYVPPGGTSPRANIGHVNAALELRRQVDEGVLPAPDFLYVALGSLGTAAGLALGLKIAGMSTRVVGVVTSYRWYCTRGRLTRIARATLKFMRKHDPTVPLVPIHPADFTVVKSALGKGYAIPTEAGRKLADEINRLEGLRTDATYSAKVLDGAMQFIEKNKAQDKRHLFWHTYAPLPLPALSTAQIPSDLRCFFEDK